MGNHLFRKSSRLFPQDIPLGAGWQPDRTCGCFCFSGGEVYAADISSSSSKNSDDSKNSDETNISFLNSNETEYKNDVVVCRGNVIVVYNKKIISEMLDNKIDRTEPFIEGRI